MIPQSISVTSKIIAILSISISYHNNNCSYYNNNLYKLFIIKIARLSQSIIVIITIIYEL